MEIKNISVLEETRSAALFYTSVCDVLQRGSPKYPSNHIHQKHSVEDI